MADYARRLLADRTKTDCLKLALMAYKAGQVEQGSSATVKVEVLLSTLTEYQWFYFRQPSSQPQSDPAFRVGIQPPELGGFADTGFKDEFKDTGNQVRHFVASFAAGYIFGIPAADAVTWIRESLYRSGNQPDAALGYLGASLGGFFGAGDTTRLAQDIWLQACGQTTPLQLP